jgi:hypothetical protein
MNDTDAKKGAAEIPPRSIKDGPWCWASKCALRRLMESTGETADVACRARSVYLALCELASDAASETFTVAKALIAYRAGLSIRTVQRVLPDLEHAGVLLVVRSAGVKTASTYTLLSDPRGNGVSTSGHNGSTIGHGTGKGHLADKVEEGSEERKVETKNCTAPGGAGAMDSSEGSSPALGTRKNPRPLPKDLAEVSTAAESLGISAETARAFVHFQKFHAWRMNGSPLVDWHKTLGGFAKADHKRKRELKLDGLTNAEFWAFVDAEHIEHATANAWIRAVEKKHWKLRNPANSQLEPIHDFKAALRAFVGSDLNQILESIGHYDE